MTRRARRLFEAAEQWKPPQGVAYMVSFIPHDETIVCYMQTEQCLSTREINPDARPSMVGSSLDAMCSTLLCDSDEKARMGRVKAALSQAGVIFEHAIAVHTN